MEINTSSASSGVKSDPPAEQPAAQASERNAERDRDEVDATSRERIERSDAGPGVGRRVDLDA